MLLLQPDSGENMKYSKMTNKNLKKRCLRGDSKACHALKKKMGMDWRYQPRGKRRIW